MGRAMPGAQAILLLAECQATLFAGGAEAIRLVISSTCLTTPAPRSAAPLPAP